MPLWNNQWQSLYKKSVPLLSGCKPPGLSVPLHFLESAVSRTMKNTGGRVHINGLSLGFHHKPSEMGPISNRLDCSRHPASRPCLCPQSIYYLIGRRSVCSPRITQSWHICIDAQWRHVHGPQGNSRGYGVLWRSRFLWFPTSAGHTCLWPVLWNKSRPADSLFLMLNLTHHLSKTYSLLALLHWRLQNPGLNDCSCRGNLFGMHASNSSPNSLPLPRCPGPPGTATIPSSSHIAAQPPWKPIWNCASSYQRWCF